MKRILTLMTVAGLLLSMTACVWESGGKIEECRGYIEDIFTEGSGADKAEVIAVSLGELTMYFTAEENTEYFRHCYDPDSTESISKDDLFIGAYVQIEYTAYEDSGYHPIRKITIIDEDRVLEVTKYSVRKIGGTGFDVGSELSENDAALLLKILEGYEWEEGASDCAADYSFNLEGIVYQYYSECGTFDRSYFTAISSFSSREPEGQGASIRLTEEDKATVDTLLEAYE